MFIFHDHIPQAFYIIFPYRDASIPLAIHPISHHFLNPADLGIDEVDQIGGL
jgi:hypothetical protein